ncbi:GtrA family protein [Pseudomonas morbosilactucae]|uniref:GtrA family protein n=1 Tax=Pseudomonas morbosilactucae TaxID=2938197 RepID=UPI003CC5A358
MINRELATFLIVGILTVLIDFLTYRALTQDQVISIEIAKAISFISGTLFAYIANRIWTFGKKSHQSGTAWKFFTLYSSTLGANVLINSTILNCFTDSALITHLAFLTATCVSATLNFLGMKYIVFRPSTVQESQ